jgi:ribose transport system substrate-binding protein
MNPGQKLSVLVSLITQDNDYQREQAAVAESLAHKFDVTVKVEYADNDAVNQTLQLLKAIQASPESRPNAVVVEPVGTSMAQVAQAAAAANIGWVVLNGSAEYLGKLRLKYQVPLFWLASDNEEVGRIEGKQFNLLMPRGGVLLYIEGPAASDVVKKRTHGMLSVKRHDLDVKAIRGGWTELGAYNAVKSWLRLPTSRELHIGMVGCQNDAMAVGARKAFDEHPDQAERARFLSLPFTGCDGVASKGQAWVRQGLLAATVVTPALTGIALEMMAHGLRSRIQPVEQTLVSPKSYPPLEELRSAKLEAHA